MGIDKSPPQPFHPALTPAPKSAIRPELQVDPRLKKKANEVLGLHANTSSQKPVTISLLPCADPDNTSRDAPKDQPARGYIISEFRLLRQPDSQGGPSQTPQVTKYYRVGDREDATTNLLVSYDEIGRYVSAKEREDWEQRPEKMDALDQMLKSDEKQHEEWEKATDRAIAKLLFLETETITLEGRPVTRGMTKAFFR
ncbi:hypothetical protein QBC40DRAFT_322024 [Triangularia verruculosa]|uniref:Uncharacterized protein n=1 Tax=Triangularia verruculosa TaxID=2587418 RepID=A0AAN6XL59_9PEZI|nr:hypothetical protein QBC40DRAFT_322024 [Triangularia verruculosa]